MQSLHDELDSIAARTNFSGVIGIDRAGEVDFAKAYGSADRAHDLPNTVDTRFGLASGSKGFTALATMRLVNDGTLELTTPARAVLGGDLPLIDDGVTVEHLLAHRSGIGDYLDEDAGHEITDYVMPVPVQELATTEQFLAVLGGHPTVFPPGERFAYCNGGFMVLALIAERASGTPFHDLVRSRVTEPAGMGDTEYLRSDALPGRAALGYLTDDDPTTNVFHLPVRGNGDGGPTPPSPTSARSGTRSSPGGSCRASWWPRWCGPAATFPGRRSGTAWASGSNRQGTSCCWRDTTRVFPFGPAHDPDSATTYTVMANTSEGAWSFVELLDEWIAT